MKPKAKKPVKNGNSLRTQILNSARASFKLEGIHISERDAKRALKKIEVKLKSPDDHYPKP